MTGAGLLQDNALHARFHGHADETGQGLGQAVDGLAEKAGAFLQCFLGFQRVAGGHALGSDLGNHLALHVLISAGPVQQFLAGLQFIQFQGIAIVANAAGIRGYLELIPRRRRSSELNPPAVDIDISAAGIGSR